MLYFKLNIKGNNWHSINNLAQNHRNVYESMDSVSRFWIRGEMELFEKDVKKDVKYKILTGGILKGLCVILCPW